MKCANKECGITTYIKTMKVIDSCKTIDHLVYTKRYISLAFKELDRIQAKIVYNHYVTKIIETLK